MLAALNLPNKHADLDEPARNHTINMEACFIWVWGLMQSSGKLYKEGLSPPWAGFVVVCWPRTEPDVTSYASNIHTATFTV